MLVLKAFAVIIAQHEEYKSQHLIAAMKQIKAVSRYFGLISNFFIYLCICSF